jgi:hypothetical protein
MLTLMNVAIGAILGVVLVESPIFHITRFSDLSGAFEFIVLLILQSLNIQASIVSLMHRHYHFLTYSIGIYLFMEALVFLSFTIDPSLLPAGQEGVAVRFTGIGYMWLFVLMTLMWMVSNLLAAAWDQFGPT